MVDVLHGDIKLDHLAQELSEDDIQFPKIIN